MTPAEELRWLADRRPDQGAAEASSTARARGELLAHARGRRRRRRAAEGLAAAAALAAVAVGVILDTGSSVAPPAQPSSGNVTRRASAPPNAGVAGSAHVGHSQLVSLALHVRATPTPHQPGNATLVVRDTRIDGHHTIDGAVYGGYDLYTDAGVYYYAPDSLVQLQQLVNAHKPSIGGSGLGRVVPTLARYAGQPPWRVRKAMYRAEPHASAAQIRRELSTLPPRVRRFYEPHRVSPAQARLSIDSLDYIDATEALAIGAGRADVRAGAMEVLSTLKGVREHVTRLDGVRALRVTYPNTLSGRLVADATETIWLDAQTGVPIQEQDGPTSATRFIVLRVDTDHLPAPSRRGMSSGDREDEQSAH